MEMYRSTQERRCPDCGAPLEAVADGAYVCTQEQTEWVEYSPKLLLRPAKLDRTPLELPWETRKAA